MKSKKNQNKSHKIRDILVLFWVFFKIGLFTFGGGYAMIPIIQKEVIEKKKWISELELMDILVIAESTPGPISVNTATYVGYQVFGFFGSLVATLGLVIPSFFIIFFISLYFDEFIAIKWVTYAFTGISAAVGVLIISAAAKLLKKMKKRVFFIVIALLTAGLSIAFSFLNINFSSVFFILSGIALSVALSGKDLIEEEVKDKQCLLSHGADL